MENQNVASESKKQSATKSLKFSQMKKVSPEAAKLLSALRERANKKTFGRKIKESEIIEVALKLVTQSQLDALREQTYSAQDRLRMRHDEYQKANGKLSFDSFIEKWMNGDLVAQVPSARV